VIALSQKSDRVACQELEAKIRQSYYWDGRKGGEEDYKTGKPVPMKDLREALKRSLDSKKHYYSMSPKARRFGLWKGQGKLINHDIKVFRNLITQKQKVIKKCSHT
jgi:hypothetical protein